MTRVGLPVSIINLAMQATCLWVHIHIIWIQFPNPCSFWTKRKLLISNLKQFLPSGSFLADFSLIHHFLVLYFMPLKLKWFTHLHDSSSSLSENDHLSIECEVSSGVIQIISGQWRLGLAYFPLCYGYYGTACPKLWKDIP